MTVLEFLTWALVVSSDLAQVQIFWKACLLRCDTVAVGTVVFSLRTFLFMDLCFHHQAGHIEFNRSIMSLNMRPFCLIFCNRVVLGLQTNSISQLVKRVDGLTCCLQRRIKTFWNSSHLRLSLAAVCHRLSRHVEKDSSLIAVDRTIPKIWTANLNLHGSKLCQIANFFHLP